VGTALAPFMPMSTATQPASLRVLLVDDGSPQLPLLYQELARLGCTVLGVVDSGLELASRVADLQPDMIIIGADSPSRDTLEGIAVMSQAAPRPIVLFTDDPDRERMKRALRAGVSSYVVQGLAAERLGPLLDVALARFEADASLRAELEAAKGELAARKQIERAKGILMSARGLDEEAAYAELRKMAMDRGMKLAEIAAKVIEAKSLLS
jgi:response regulator NasT